MTPEKLLEIARRELPVICVHHIPEDIISFAQAIIEAEREKHADLIAAAEAVIARWETPLWKDAGPTAVAVYRMKDVIEKCKNEN